MRRIGASIGRMLSTRKQGESGLKKAWPRGLAVVCYAADNQINPHKKGPIWRTRLDLLESVGWEPIWHGVSRIAVSP